MLKVEHRSFFRLIHFLSIAFVAGCNPPFPDTSSDEALFMLIDVGQGLSQMLVQNNRAVLFDMGPREAQENWKSAYTSLGKPHIEAIIISHRDLDHSGGLYFLDSSTAWSGMLIAGRWEDTTLLRRRCSNWRAPILIGTVVQDTVIRLLENCTVRCLWPPSAIDDTFPVPDSRTNYYSVVCLVAHGNNRIMITGDIDSTVELCLAQRYRTELRADLVVVPHHGSAAGVCPIFFSYIKPICAMISYGNNNPYGHPSPAVLSMLMEQAVPCSTTVTSGSLLWKSNRYYWTPFR